jgi:hypothetical protein
MALSKEEQELLADLQRREQEGDEEDFEIEVYDTAKGRGARIPFSKGRNWLWNEFGIGEDPNPKTDDKGKKPSGKEDDGSAQRKGYFGRQAG